MISIVAHGIMGTRYLQKVVVDDDARVDDNIQSLFDIRRFLSIQYGDGTPIAGWAMQPTPDGMWLSRIERAFDANYAPAYVMVSFLIPQGCRLPGNSIECIEDNLMQNHSRYLQQSVIKYDADWSFLVVLGRQLETMIDSAKTDDDDHCHECCSSEEVAYYPGPISSMLQIMWTQRFRRFGIVFCGNELLSEHRMVSSIEDVISGDDESPESTKDNITENVPNEVMDESDQMVNSFGMDEDTTPRVVESSDIPLGQAPSPEEISIPMLDLDEEREKQFEPPKVRRKNRVVQLFSFKGEIGRLPYCMTLYGSFLLDIVYLIVLFGIPTWIRVVFFLPVLWMIFSQGAKRCHDLGHSGWFQLIPFYVFFMMFKGSKTTDRKYTKDVVLVLLAAIFALFVPMAITGAVNNVVSDFTGQWYLKDETRIVITICITIVTYLLSYLLIRQTIVKKSILFNLISFALTFLWCVSAGVVNMPD